MGVVALLSRYIGNFNINKGEFFCADLLYKITVKEAILLMEDY